MSTAATGALEAWPWSSTRLGEQGGLAQRAGHSRARLGPAQMPSYLPEDKGLLVVHGVQAVVHHHARAELLADGVRGQPVHVHLHVGANLLV